MQELQTDNLNVNILTFEEMAEQAAKNFIANFDEKTFNKEKI
jgi:hypothetical protein